MSDQNQIPADDTDDVQGHLRQRANEERDETTDDVSGHHFRAGAQEERDETTDDTEGHFIKFGIAEARDDEDDVAGHLSGALGAQKRD